MEASVEPSEREPAIESIPSSRELPIDCISRALSYCSPADICRASAVCKSWEAAACLEATWRHILPPLASLAADFPGMKEGADPRHILKALRSGIASLDGSLLLATDPVSASLCLHFSVSRTFTVQRTSHPLSRPKDTWRRNPPPGSIFRDVLSDPDWLRIHGVLSPRFLLPAGTYSVEWSAAKSGSSPRWPLVSPRCTVVQAKAGRVIDAAPVRLWGPGQPSFQSARLAKRDSPQIFGAECASVESSKFANTALPQICNAERASFHCSHLADTASPQLCRSCSSLEQSVAEESPTNSESSAHDGSLPLAAAGSSTASGSADMGLACARASGAPLTPIGGGDSGNVLPSRACSSHVHSEDEAASPMAGAAREDSTFFNSAGSDSCTNEAPSSPLARLYAVIHHQESPVGSRSKKLPRRMPDAPDAELGGTVGLAQTGPFSEAPSCSSGALESLRKGPSPRRKVRAHRRNSFGKSVGAQAGSRDARRGDGSRTGVGSREEAPRCGGGRSEEASRGRGERREEASRRGRRGGDPQLRKGSFEGHPALAPIRSVAEESIQKIKEWKSEALGAVLGSVKWGKRNRKARVYDSSILDAALAESGKAVVAAETLQEDGAVNQSDDSKDDSNDDCSETREETATPLFSKDVSSIPAESSSSAVVSLPGEGTSAKACRRCGGAALEAGIPEGDRKAFEWKNYHAGTITVVAEEGGFGRLRAYVRLEEKTGDKSGLFIDSLVLTKLK